MGGAGESRKELAAAGLEPQRDVLAHGLPNEETAFRIEAAVIDALRRETLANQVRGWKSVQFGRMPLEELCAYYAAEPVEVRHPSLLIRVNRLYRHRVTSNELYEVTRGVWKLGERRWESSGRVAGTCGCTYSVHLNPFREPNPPQMHDGCASTGLDVR